MPVGRDISGWLATTFAPGITDRVRRTLAEVGGPDLEWPARVRLAAGRIAGLDLAETIERGRDDPRMARTLDWLDRSGHHLLSIVDPAYPPLLREIDDAPVLLYACGRLDLLDRPALAMVGSRNPSPLGVQTAGAFARCFSDAGLTVVSGLALGIDTAAHCGALESRAAGSGSTIAVVGTGLDIVYPAKNRGLAARIAEEGTLVSEFPLGLAARPDHFPRRNRILSGLALGCLVVEANLRSGSLITARLAAQQGREVFAIPGSIHTPLSKGCHLLIREGAKLTENVADVVQELGWARPVANTAAAPAPEPGLGADPSALLAELTHDPMSPDTLAGRLGWTPQRVDAALVELELAGRVAATGHGLFQRLAEPGFGFARAG
ncbi:MAG: DNA-processing protein DprA [bacterium]|jgi:DNA processing protein|nr:DNA-processing protein DprA [Betaproteobacteria bacterium]